MAKKVFTEQTVTVGELHEGGYCPSTEDPRFCVYGTLPGETLKAKPFTKRQRKLFARPTELIEVSPHRVTPPCSVADICGGCSLQHLATDEQIKHKQQVVQGVFGDNQPQQWYSPLCADVSSYRAKARLGVKFVDKKGKVLVGFREKLKPFIVETQSCHVLKKPAGDLLPVLSQLVESLSTPRDIPQIEVAVGVDDIGEPKVAMVFRHLSDLTDLDTEKFQAFGHEHEIDVYLQPGKPDSIHKLYPDNSSQYLRYQLKDFALTFEFLPLDFTQVNASINEKMVPRALELLQLNQSDVVLDAFCGIGNFSLPLAQQVSEVIGIEGSEDSVDRARHNADLNGINNAVFIAQDLFAEGQESIDLQKVNKVLLDPPRSGAEALCKVLASRKVERVVYVSCNPVTLARDAEILVSNGYKFEGAGVIDMFPHTTHVESIASFTI